MMRQGRSARTFPSAGAIDLIAMLRALPTGIPISVEAPLRSAAPATLCGRLRPRAPPARSSRRPTTRAVVTA